MIIHTKVAKANKKPEVNTYPYIGILKDKKSNMFDNSKFDSVVLFIDDNTGTLLKGPLYKDCGMYRTDWDEPRFKKLDTGSTVTLTVE